MCFCPSLLLRATFSAKSCFIRVLVVTIPSILFNASVLHIFAVSIKRSHDNSFVQLIYFRPIILVFGRKSICWTKKVAYKKVALTSLRQFIIRLQRYLAHHPFALALARAVALALVLADWELDLVSGQASVQDSSCK